jgi:hypothetical protein
MLELDAQGGIHVVICTGDGMIDHAHVRDRTFTEG